VSCRRRFRWSLRALIAALAMIPGAAFGQTPAPMPVPEAAPAPSMTAERVWAAARPKLLQIRTLVAAAGRQSTIGSGFLVSGDGLAITNYHVVSQFALEAATYRLEYTMADGSRGDLDLLAIDLANDLAVVRLKGRGTDPFFGFDERALRNELSKMSADDKRRLVEELSNELAEPAAG
jgi:S1-C subfamily serine protease